LLRYAYSPAIGSRRAGECVDDAWMLLGCVELYRWLSAQLMSASATRQAWRALEEGALARGRIREDVACQRGNTNQGAHSHWAAAVDPAAAAGAEGLGAGAAAPGG